MANSDKSKSKSKKAGRNILAPTIRTRNMTRVLERKLKRTLRSSGRVAALEYVQRHGLYGPGKKLGLDVSTLPDERAERNEKKKAGWDLHVDQKRSAAFIDDNAE